MLITLKVHLKEFLESIQVISRGGRREETQKPDENKEEKDLIQTGQ